MFFSKVREALLLRLTKFLPVNWLVEEVLQLWLNVLLDLSEFVWDRFRSVLITITSASNDYVANSMVHWLLCVGVLIYITEQPFSDRYDGFNLVRCLDSRNKLFL